MAFRKTVRNPYFRIALVALILLVSWYSLTSLFPASILPGFEGEQNGIWGYQPKGLSPEPLEASMGAPSGACAYLWNGGDTIASAQVNVKTPGFFGCQAPKVDSLVFSTQANPISYSDPYSTPVQVRYYVPVPGTTNRYQLVIGQVQEYTFNTNVAVGASSAGAWSFSGDAIWFNLLSLVWNSATSTQLANGTTVQGQAFETPLYMVSVNCQWTYPGPDNAIGPCQAGGSLGGAVPFYSSPSTGGVCGTLAGLVTSSCSGVQPSTSLNGSLSSVYAPDTRMQRLVYYPVTITHMQNACSFGGLGGCNPPSVSVTFRLYTLRIGEYILTNPDRQSLTGSSQGCTGLACFSNWLAQNSLWVGLVGAVGVLIAIVVILAVFATPFMVALLFYFSSRKKGGV